MTFGIFIVYKYAEIITHFGDFVNRKWEWPEITNDPRVASEAAPRGSFVIYFSSPPVLSLLF